MAAIIDNSGIEVDLPDTFGRNDNGGNDRDRDAEEAASTYSNEEDTFSATGGGGGGSSWKVWNWNSIVYRMTFVVVLCALILLGWTVGSLSADAAKSNVVASMSSTNASKSSKEPKASKKDSCGLEDAPCSTNDDCCTSQGFQCAKETATKCTSS